MVAAERLQRLVGIDHLVVRVTVEQLRRAVVEHLAQQSGDRLALVEPLAAQRCERLRRQRLVERDEARDPAVAEILVIERVENAGPAEAREAEHGERSDVERSEEHTSELQSLMRISYAVF